MELIEMGGIEGLTLQRLAESLGYVTTAIYRYFESKDALIAALQRKTIGDLQVYFEQQVAKQVAALDHTVDQTRCLAAILATAQLYLGLPSAQPRAWHLIATLLGDPRLLLSDDESRRAAPALGAFLGGIEVLFATAANEGSIRPGDARHRTLMFWAALHGALCVSKVHRIAGNLPSAHLIGLEAVRGLLISFGATTARLSAAARALERGPG